MFNHFSYFSRDQIVEFRNFVAENKQNIDLITSRLMLAMGFKMHLCGSVYLREAIDCCFNLPSNTKISFSKTVYPYVAQKHNTTARNIDRDIRTVIQSCYSSGRILTFNEICGYEVISKNYPPSNTEFIMNVTTWIKTTEMQRDK